jgi:heptosyltransferase-3
VANHAQFVPYERVAALQRRGPVVLLQNPELPCVPCQLEGCERHRDSRSDCLDRLPPERVIAAADALLHRRPDSSAVAPSDA